jgi:hypothetical protein
MKKLVVLLCGLALGLTSCGQKPATNGGKSTNAPAAKATNETTSSGNPITAPVDYLGAVAQAKKYSEKVIDLAQLTQAIQQFHEMEDRYPKSLEELVTTHYLGAMPKAPYGMAFQYDPNTGQVKAIRTQ